MGRGESIVSAVFGVAGTVPGMRFYLDTEFVDRTGVPFALVSIGLVADNGTEYYAVNSDVDLQVLADDAWLAANVLPYLVAADAPAPKPQEQIAAEVASFCAEADDGRRGEVWAWNGAYDFFLFSQLFGHRGAIPAHVPDRFLDLKQWALSLGNPNVPSQEHGAHHALADAHHDRVVHAWLAEHERKMRARRLERARTRLLSAIANAGREVELGA